VHRLALRVHPDRVRGCLGADGDNMKKLNTINRKYATGLQLANRNIDFLRQQEETKRLRADPNSEYWVEQLEWRTEQLKKQVRDYAPIVDAEYETTRARCEAYMEAVINVQINEYRKESK